MGVNAGGRQKGIQAEGRAHAKAWRCEKAPLGGCLESGIARGTLQVGEW